MSPDELEKLTEDIRQHGLLESIVTFDGQILDGRHRAQACEAAGVEPRFEEFVGGDPVAFVLSKNLHRRHLTSAQKAAIAVEALPLLEKQAKERQRQAGEQFGRGQEQKLVEKIPQAMAEESSKSRDQAAALTGSNSHYVSDAKKIAVEAPDVFDAMKSGTVSMPEARALSQKSEPDREEILSSLPAMSPAERRAQFRVVPSASSTVEPEDPSLDGEAEDEAGGVSNDAGKSEPTDCRLSVHFSSDSPEWYTPPAVLDRVVNCLGAIDLDPCAEAQLGNVPAARHLTADDDGLAHEWQGRMFMNPPYGREIGLWIDKLAAEFEAGRIMQAIVLVPARTDTAWFRRLSAFPVGFWRGRITFIGPDGGQNPAPFPSALFALGVAPEQFAATFDDVADVYVRVQRK